MAKFYDRSKRDPFDVYLFDSGTKHLYRASMSSISMSPGSEPIAAPESGASTPEYYRQTSYSMWFKFVEIEELAIDTLRDFTYSRVDEFFTSGKSDYGIYYDKRVSSPEELIDQNRTIWFVRPHREGDQDVEISLKSMSYEKTLHFSSTFRESKARKMIWLSDLHFFRPLNLARLAWEQVQDALRVSQGNELPSDWVSPLAAATAAWVPKVDAEQVRRDFLIAASIDKSNQDTLQRAGTQLLAFVNERGCDRQPRPDQFHGFLPTGAAEDGAHHYPLVNQILNALRDTDPTEIGALIISGDLTWQAQPEEFSDAVQLVKALGERFPSLADPHNVIVCPGNHDIAFSFEPANAKSPVTRASSSARKNFESFSAAIYKSRPNEYLALGRKYLLRNCLPVEVVALNTSLLTQTGGRFQGHGFVGAEQLKYVAKGMRWEESKGPPHPIRVLVLHHPLTPVTGRLAAKVDAQYQTMLDAGDLMKWCEQYGIALVCHGHTHERFAAELGIRGDKGTRHRMHILGLGSTGVEGSHREGDNQFAILDFEDVAKMRMTTFEIGATNKTVHSDEEEFLMIRG
ncbi:MAG: metallophosphoesterase [Kofleriaceae bacterium]